MESYRTIETRGEGSYEEKKSRFLGVAIPTKTEEEVQAALQEEKKKYYDAKHHCYACILGEKGELRRFSDDGEPQGTAGKPILTVLEGQNLRNVCIIVTRYFGGTLLGTGGLTRAYGRLQSAPWRRPVPLSCSLEKSSALPWTTPCSTG